MELDMTKEQREAALKRCFYLMQLKPFPWQVGLQLHAGQTFIEVRSHTEPGVAWSNDYETDYGECEYDDFGYRCKVEYDPDHTQAVAEFIANAGSDVVGLLVEIDKLEAELALAHEKIGMMKGRIDRVTAEIAALKAAGRAFTPGFEVD